jgi:hypothetical protein
LDVLESGYRRTLNAWGVDVRPKREGRSKGSRALAIDVEAGRTDRLRVGSLTFEYEKGSRFAMLYDVLQESKAYQSIKQEGREEGELQALHQALLALVETYFPTIVGLVTKQTSGVQNPMVLQKLIVKVGRAQTLEEARQCMLAMDEGEES